MRRKTSGIILGLLLLSLTAGCGSSRIDMTQNMSETAENSSAKSEYAQSQEELDNDAGGDASSVPKINTEIEYNRKIIKNGTIHIQTEHFNESVNKLTDYVQSLKGYIESSNIQGADFYENHAAARTASLTVRIPQQSFDTFMNKGGDFGNVSYLTSNSEDVTSQYVDTETRMKALNIRKEHLLALMEKSGDLKDLFEIEKELGDVTYEIESLKGTLQNYDSLVDMSTINVEMQEVGKIEEVKPVETFANQIEATFNASVKGVMNFLKGLLLFIIALVPLLIIAVPAGIVVYLIIRKKKQRIIKKEQEKTKQKQ